MWWTAGAEDPPQAYQPYSSPIVSGGRAFVATAGVLPEEHKLLCFDVAGGKLLWKTAIPPGPVQELKLPPYPDKRKAQELSHSYGYNCPTPCTDGERVYVTFGTGVMAAVDFQGQLVWHTPLINVERAGGVKKPVDSNKYFNLVLATSPVLYKDLVIQICDNGNSLHIVPAGEDIMDYKHKASFIKAFGRRTGELRYRQDRTVRGNNASWSTPVVVALANKMMLIHKCQTGVQGIDPENGNVLWRVWKQQSTTTAPVYWSSQR